MPDPAVHRIVLTGGPCAGKTTALSHISERLQSLGVKVFIVPEAATIPSGPVKRRAHKANVSDDGDLA